MRKTRDLTKSRSEILQVTFEEVFLRSFHGVSIDEIVKRTSLTKGALYHQFPTKLDLGYALVEEVITPMIIDRWIGPLHAFEDPLQGVIEIMQKLMGEAPPEQLKLGCPLNNLVQEMSPVDPGFKARLSSTLQLWIDELAEQLERGKSNGFIRKDVNTREVAHFVVMSHEGFYGMIKGLGDRDVFKVLLSSLKIYFEGLR